jgi:hypothetical protein
MFIWSQLSICFMNFEIKSNVNDYVVEIFPVHLEATMVIFCANFSGDENDKLSKL